jgi:outer membrane murein-binding lipoprotein Lpp
MQLKGYRIELIDVKAIEKLLKQSLAMGDSVSKGVQRIAGDIQPMASQIKTAVKDLENIQSQSRTAMVQAERAKQKGQADLMRKIYDKATNGIAQYSKLAKSLNSFSKIL